MWTRASVSIALFSLVTACGSGSTAAPEEAVSSSESGGEVIERDVPAEPVEGDEMIDPSSESEEPVEETASEADEDAEDELALYKKKLRKGRIAFDRYCDSCHPGGGKDIGPTLRRIRWSVGRMKRQIRRGSGKMKPIPPKRLSNAKMDSLMIYLAKLGAVRGIQRPSARE